MPGGSLAATLGLVLALLGQAPAPDVVPPVAEPPPAPAIEVAAAARAEPELGPIGRTARNTGAVVGVSLAVFALGVLLVMFGREPLEVVSDTVAHSFPRAFVVGLLGQLLVVPTFGMAVVGLALTVVGVVLIPFVVVLFALLVLLGLVGGALAAMHAMGERQTRRQLAAGVRLSPNGYRYLVTGLTIPFSLWLLWGLFSAVPVANIAIAGAAGLVTWILVTAGFGAALLSRGGFETAFAGRLLPPEMLTDEFLWATPATGVAAVKRPTPPSSSISR